MEAFTPGISPWTLRAICAGEMWPWARMTSETIARRCGVIRRPRVAEPVQHLFVVDHRVHVRHPTVVLQVQREPLQVPPPETLAWVHDGDGDRRQRGGRQGGGQGAPGSRRGARHGAAAGRRRVPAPAGRQGRGPGDRRPEALAEILPPLPHARPSGRRPEPARRRSALRREPPLRPDGARRGARGRHEAVRPPVRPGRRRGGDASVPARQGVGGGGGPGQPTSITRSCAPPTSTGSADCGSRRWSRERSATRRSSAGSAIRRSPRCSPTTRRPWSPRSTTRPGDSSATWGLEGPDALTPDGFARLLRDDDVPIAHADGQAAAEALDALLGDPGRAVTAVALRPPESRRRAGCRRGVRRRSGHRSLEGCGRRCGPPPVWTR